MPGYFVRGKFAVFQNTVESQFQDLGQSRTWHFEVSAVQICRGLSQIKNYDPKADPSSVRPVDYPRRETNLFDSRSTFRQKITIYPNLSLIYSVDLDLFDSRDRI